MSDYRSEVAIIIGDNKEITLGSKVLNMDALIIQALYLAKKLDVEDYD